jgi:uncharacterized membrane protein
VDSKRRSLAKALSWRGCALIITAGVGYVLSNGSIAFALTLGLVDSLIKIMAYYVHERAWINVDYGRLRPPEYEI